MFHVITPLARFENIEKLVNILEPKNIKWHVLIDQGYSHDNVKCLTYKSWIKVYYCPNDGVAFYERCNKSINWFIETQEIIDSEMYCILNDDDAYEPEFFNKISNELKNNSIDEEYKNVVICSMERGSNIPENLIEIRKHPTYKLWATKDSMHVGGVGIEQILLKGKILKNYRIPLAPAGDGEFIVNILNNHKAFMIPGASVWFNYFEEGRWQI